MTEPETQPPAPTPAGEDSDVVQVPDGPLETGPDDQGPLTVTADELELPEPSLADPAISADVADEVALDEVAAETQAVQAQADRAATLSGGPTAQAASDKDKVQQKIESAAAKAREQVTDEQE